LFPYTGTLKVAISLLKYQGKVVLDSALCDLVSLEMSAKVLPACDGVLPVPLHPLRLREREFNQAALLATMVSRILAVPRLCGALRRDRETLPQTALSRTSRQNNLRGAFSVARPDVVKGKTLLLVDDVMTTGATVHECAKVLRKAGAGDVFVLTLARTCR
jgi:ComF family protein